MALKVALLGAGGKMGCRITDNIKDLPEYDMYYVEVSEQGIANLKERGLSVTSEADAVEVADAVVLALPDKLIGKISKTLVPKLKSGTILIGLDPAAAYGEVMPIRDDITYFVAHPCHPPVFNDEVTAEAKTDWFGGIHAKQNIVCALYHGPEEDYAKGEGIAKAMYAPVIESYRVTVEQMAILEPALVETTLATLLMGLREAFDQTIEMGVPEDAARAFLFGHIRTILAIMFDMSGFPLSDGALLAVEQAYGKIFQPDWKENIMNHDALKQSVANITDS